MASSPERSGVRLAGLRELLLPIAVIACLSLYHLAQVPWWSMALLAVPFAVLYGLAPAWAARSTESFDRDLVHLLSTGRREALPARYARAIGMRLFAPLAVRTERHAVVAAENGLSHEARASYRRALREYGPHAPLRVLLGYAHASYALGDDDEAISVYRSLLAQTGSLPGVQRNLAHAMVRRGESLREALTLIDGDAQNGATPERKAEFDLLRAVAHAKLGERDRAQALLEQSSAAQGDTALELRAELYRALEGASEPHPG
jgi:tetratricopeptide (TPR) repeat protein